MSVNLSINGIPVSVPEGATILQAAKAASVAIPTLCHLGKTNTISACRVCVVEVRGAPTLKAACSTPVSEGMEITTDSPAVRTARRRNLELLCSDHTMACTECPRGADCELRELCREYGADDEAFGKGFRAPLRDGSMPHLLRDNAKCILCRRCEATCRVTQTVGAIFVNRRAGETAVGFGLPLRETDCVSCGQCVRACPTGALSVHDDTKVLWKAIYDRDKYVVAALSPEAARSLGRLFGNGDDPEGFGKAAAMLRRSGVDLVLDPSAFAAEFGKSVRAAVAAADPGGPAIQCTCFAARQFIECFYPALSGNILPLRHRRNALAQRCKAELADKDVFFISIDGCLSAKTERARDPDCPVDAALTARELFTLIRQCCVSSFTAGEIWGSILPEAPDALPFLGEPRPSHEREAVTEKELRIGDRVLRAVEVTGLGAARAILENPSRWDYIKLDACPGGCADGGGMPRKKESVSREGMKKEEAECHTPNGCAS